ncbi:MAG: tyrosine-type recombinase/integrase [Fusobacterium necrophorum]|nr:tyrosine-type recombinase/integrase [Fusobacterium necrophorum]
MIKTEISANEKEVFAIEKQDLILLRNYFSQKNKIIVLSIINIGINVALRYSDLSQLCFEDINKEGIVRVREQKTKKIRDFKLNKVCLENLEKLKEFYIKQNIPIEGFLFKSMNPYYRKHHIDKPLTLQSFNRYLRIARQDLSLSYRIGSHSLRKTWGYFYYEKTKDIAMIMKILNHSSVSMTLKYLGIDRQRIYDTYDTFLI